MHIPDVIDPFHLDHLLEDIDRQCYRLLTADFHSTVDAPAFLAFKVRLRDEVATLLTEIISDMQEIQNRIGRPDVLSWNRTVAHAAEHFAPILPTIFMQPIKTGDEQVDKDAQVAWFAKRLTWAADIWMLLQIEFFQTLERIGVSEAPVTITYPDGRQQSVPPIPLFGLQGLYKSWQMLHQATLEYLQAKAALLQGLGEDVPGLSIDFDLPEQLLSESRAALNRGDKNAHVAMEQALREVLLRVVQMPDGEMSFDLRNLPTSYLVFIAHRAGLPLLFDVQLLTDLMVDFEIHRSQCRTPPLSLLIPAMRIIEAAVRNLGSIQVDVSLPSRVKRMLDEEVQREANG